QAPAVASAYWPGWDITRGIALLPGATLANIGGYTLDGYGGMHPFGTAPNVGGVPYWGWDIARSIAMWTAAPAGSPGGWVLDGYGALHPFGTAPVRNASTYWAGWDIARAAGGGGDGASSYGRLPSQPLRILPTPYYHQELSLSCEAASLRMALTNQGIYVSETSLTNA